MPILKTFILIAGVTAFFGFVGSILGGQQGMLIALLVAAGMNFFAYYSSDKIALKVYNARPVAEGEYENLQSIVKELSFKANIPSPKFYIIENSQPNAFATGRNPENGAVAVTTGLLQILNESEVRGVIAHEIAHIKNRDTLIMTITATIAGAISMLANFAMFFGGNRENNNAIVSMIVAILAPIAAMLVQMAISRTREYEADRVGAEISSDPDSLASALAKISNGASKIDNYDAENNPSTAHMFIINPLHARSVDNLFSTHPKTENRIAALNHLKETNPSLNQKKKVRKGTFSNI
jgi:heat shock protein HtpX